MIAAEHSLSYMLRNSGAVLEELEGRDVILLRRDGEDLYLALRSRQTGVRELLGVMARMVRAALHDESAHAAIAAWLADEMPWTSFLPPEDREAFLADFANTATACAELDVYEPLLQSLDGWKATAEVYADPRLLDVMREEHGGPAVPLRRSADSRAPTR